jgi:carbonic anhydrase/acetyltransferase-like protein (isoleucine patch superfamily)
LANGCLLRPMPQFLVMQALGDDVSVWFGAVIRADGDSITIGARSNIQDNAVIHVDPGFPTTIGHSCIVGHLALVHGASIGNHVLVGMHSIILNGAVIGDYCMIGANALVTAGTIIPPYSLWSLGGTCQSGQNTYRNSNRSHSQKRRGLRKIKRRLSEFCRKFIILFGRFPTGRVFLLLSFCSYLSKRITASPPNAAPRKL